MQPLSHSRRYRGDEQHDEHHWTQFNATVGTHNLESKDGRATGWTLSVTNKDSFSGHAKREMESQSPGHVADCGVGQNATFLASVLVY